MKDQVTGGRTASELCDEFENDIRYDAHSLQARIGRSKAGEQLIALGVSAFAAIVRHNGSRKSTSLPAIDEEVDTAWCTILAAIKRNIEPNGEAPSSLQRWLVWASERVPVC